MDWKDKKLWIGVLVVLIVLISVWSLLSFFHPKFCLNDSCCKYEKCESGCVNKYVYTQPCQIKAALWSSYVWKNMPCKCVNNRCVEDKEAFCRKACKDWMNKGCEDGIPKSAFLELECESQRECLCPNINTSMPQEILLSLEKRYDFVVNGTEGWGGFVNASDTVVMDKTVKGPPPAFRPSEDKIICVNYPGSFEPMTPKEFLKYIIQVKKSNEEFR